MALIDTYLPKMRTIVTVEPRTGTTGSGQPLYGPLRYYRAYLNADGELFRTRDGQQIVSGATVYLHPLEVNADGTPKVGAVRLTAFPENSRITWPDPSLPGGVAKPVILRVNGINDESGTVQYWKVHT